MAATVSGFMLERLTGITSEVDLGSEYRYRDAVLGPETLVIALSQSGETADTLEAMRHVRRQGLKTIAVINVPDSTLAPAGRRACRVSPEWRSAQCAAR